MPDYEFKITTPAELSGAKEVLASLEAQIIKAKALGVALEKLEQLEAKRDRVKKGITDFVATPEGKQASDELEKAGQGIAGATKEVGFFNKEAKESQALLAALSTSGIPGVGLAATAAFSGATAAIAAVGLAVGEFVAQIREANKELEEYLATSVKLSTAKGIYAGVSDAVRAATSETRAYIHTLEEARKAEISLQQALQDSIKEIDAKSAAQTKLAGLQSSLYSDELEDLKKRGVITEAQAKVYTALIAQQETVNRLRAEGSKEAAKLAEQEAALAKLNQQLDQTQNAIALANPDLATAKTELANLNKKLEEAREVTRPGSKPDEAFQKANKFFNENLRSRYPDFVDLTDEELKKKEATNQAALDVSLPGALPEVDYEQQRIKQFRDESQTYRNVRATRDEAQTRATELPAKITAQQAVVDDLEQVMGRFRKEADAASASIAELSRSIQSARDDLRANTATRNQEAAIGQRRTDIVVQENGGIPNRPRSPQTAAEFYRRDVESLNGGQIARQINEARRATASRDAEFLGFLGEIARSNAGFAREVAALRKQVLNQRPGSN